MVSKYVCLLLSLMFYYTNGDPIPFFRKDYNYDRLTASFYKYHSIERGWFDAKRTCALEGATLLYPRDKAEADALRTVFWDSLGTTSSWIGIHAPFDAGFYETIDGLPISDVYHKWEQGRPASPGGCVTLHRYGLMFDKNCDLKLKFVCRKPLSFLTWNVDCNMPYTDYTYNPELQKCYKLHLNPRNWTEAYRTCASELSYLTIVDSPDELNFLLNEMVNATPSTSDIQPGYQQGQFFVGIHHLSDEGWRTVKGTPLDTTKGLSWSINEPSGSEDCGAIIAESGGLNDISCHRTCMFVCEHDVENIENINRDFLTYIPK